jgi:hypothetical protein
MVGHGCYLVVLFKARSLGVTIVDVLVFHLRGGERACHSTKGMLTIVTAITDAKRMKGWRVITSRWVLLVVLVVAVVAATRWFLELLRIGMLGSRRIGCSGKRTLGVRGLSFWRSFSEWNTIY